jgi:prepilin peptidase CpaA
MTPFAVTVLALATTLALAVTDLRTGKMPNWLTFGSLVSAFGVRWLLEGRSGLIAALIGTIVVVAIPLGLFLLTRGKAIGGGDVKALGALGAWLGPMAGLEAEMLGFTFLALFALTWECVRGRGAALLRRSFALVIPRLRQKTTQTIAEVESLQMRFGPALFLGTLVTCAALVSGA